jgi:GNAT superfamily N-acetyltransferase
VAVAPARRLAGPVEIRRFDPASDDQSVQDCHEIYLAAGRVDIPQEPLMSYRMFKGWITYGWAEAPTQNWLATGGTAKARGWYMLTLPEWENRHSAEVWPVVHPAGRRTGLGCALVAHASQQARLAGRTLLMGDCPEGTAGEAFARALGARSGVTEIIRVLRLAAIPPGHLAKLREQAGLAACDYSLFTWEGLTPADRLESVAGLYQALEDAPRDAGLEAQRWDTGRLRRSDSRIAAQGFRYYTVAAQRRDTGELAALTQVCVDPPNPEWGYQELTAVARPHRGHRLGLLVKVAMLEWLATAEPQLRQVITGNADGNKHMIAINAGLGYEPLSRWGSWELPLR